MEEKRTTLKQEFKLLKNFYIYHLIWGLASFLPAYWILYFQDIGLSFTKISTILSIAFIAPIIFEVPTGAIADHFGRKISVAIGILAVGLFLILIPFTTNFLLLILLFFSFQSFGTLISGSDSAWMVDFLKSKRKMYLMRSAFARIASIFAIGGSLAMLGASFIVGKYGMKPLWYIQGSLMLIAGFYVLLFGDKEIIIKKGNFRNALRNTFGFAKKGFKLIFIRKTLFFFVLAMFFGMFFNIGGLVWQPFFRDVGIPLAHIGIVYAGAIVAGVIAPNISNHFVKVVKSEKWALIFEDVLVGSLFIVVSMVVSPLLAILVFYSGAFGESLAQPVKSAFLHKHIPSKIRATTASIKNLFESAGGIIALLAAGYIIDSFGLRIAFVFGGLAAIPTVICYLMIKDKKNEK